MNVITTLVALILSPIALLALIFSGLLVVHGTKAFINELKRK